MSTTEPQPHRLIARQQPLSDSFASRRARCRVSGALAQSLHDFAVTPDYYVLYQSPVMFNLHKFATEFLTGDVSLAECVELVRTMYRHVRRPRLADCLAENTPPACPHH